MWHWFFTYNFIIIVIIIMYICVLLYSSADLEHCPAQLSLHVNKLN
jgi:hypothetical protein